MIARSRLRLPRPLHALALVFALLGLVLAGEGAWQLRRADGAGHALAGLLALAASAALFRDRKAQEPNIQVTAPAAVPRARAAARIPSEPPSLRGKPLAPHLIAARRHLPETPPPGWSAPMAIDDLGGAWLIEPDDDCRILACLATVKGRVVLAVTILPPLRERVAEVHALEHLRHFRDIGEFIPEDVEDHMPGARLYLAELRTGSADRAHPQKKTREMLN